MNAGAIGPGCVLHWKDFKFHDGDTADKFLVILGCKTGCNYLAVLGTSKKHRKTFTPGCNAKDEYYFIPGGGKDFFPLDTWLLLSEPYELVPAEILQKAMTDKSVEVAGTLRAEMANAIRNCLKQCEDVSAHHLSLL